MQTPEPFPPVDRFSEPEPERPAATLPRNDGLWTLGDRLAWLAGLVLAVSAFTGWYVGSGEGGITLSVIGWHTGTLGILVFFIGLAVLALTAVREAGWDLFSLVPESLVTIALGALATIFVLIRVIEIPDRFLPADGQRDRDLDQPGRRTGRDRRRVDASSRGTVSPTATPSSAPARMSDG